MPIPLKTPPVSAANAKILNVAVGLSVDTMKIDIDCFNGGYSVVGIAPHGYTDIHVSRFDERTGMTPVRALTKDHLKAGRAFGIVDYEVPLKDVREYVLTATKSGKIEHLLVPVTVGLDSCPHEFYLRSVFKPKEVIRDFCLGEIEEVDYKPKAGVYTVLGRRDPVVVVDSQETARGTLRFISQNRGQLDELKRLLAFEIEPLLLQVDPDYDLGMNGVLYFMPLEVRDRWVLSDARVPKHVFEVSFIEISRPPMTMAITEVGIKFSESPDKGLKEHYSTFGDLTLSGKNFFEAQYADYTAAP